VRVASRHTDENLARACVDALRAHASVPDDKLRVVVGGAWVKLEGIVDWQYQKEAAERAIRYIDGIRGITNNIQLSPRVSASDIKGKIEDAFQRNAQIDADQVTVQAHGNTVILHGRVRSWAEKEQAQNIAWSSPGVTAVDNQIVVTS
jgi:osmotically-inducible protein OsmY